MTLPIIGRNTLQYPRHQIMISRFSLPQNPLVMQECELGKFITIIALPQLFVWSSPFIN